LERKECHNLFTKTGGMSIESIMECNAWKQIGGIMPKTEYIAQLGQNIYVSTIWPYLTTTKKRSEAHVFLTRPAARVAGEQIRRNNQRMYPSVSTPLAGIREVA